MTFWVIWLYPIVYTTIGRRATEIPHSKPIRSVRVPQINVEKEKKLMKRLSHLSFIAALVWLSTMMFSTYPAIAQSGGNNYAYLVITGGTSADIVIIDVNNPNSAAVRRNYPIPEGWSPTRQISLSPDGAWVVSALLSNDQQTLMIQLYNMSSGETREVAQGAISTKGRNIAWSPDSRYLALNIAQGSNSRNTFVYSVADGTLTNLTNDDTDHYDIGWSPTSTDIATFTKVCSQNTTCIGRVEFFDVLNGLREGSIDLPMPFGDSIACELTISPDRQYVAFVSRCASQPEVATDVYLWNVTDGSVTQVTDVFATEPNEAPIQATYNVAWLETLKMLIGVDYQLFAQPEANQLMTYDVSQTTVTLVSTMLGTSFVLDPTSEQIGILLHPTDSEATSPANQDRIATISSDALARNANALSTEAIDAATNVPPGCGLMWSLDGMFLSYTMYTEGDCQGEITGFVFHNPSTRTGQQHSIALDGVTATDVVIPLGWVVS